MFDCTTCGACCRSPASNREQNFRFYVEIQDGCGMLDRPDQKKFVVRDDWGRPHMRLDNAGRCVALVGPIGKKVRCTVYGDRPSPCKRVTAGDDDCLRARREAGFDDGEAGRLAAKRPRR